MSAVEPLPATGWLPLLEATDRPRALLYRSGGAVVDREQFLAEARALAAALPAHAHALNLCEDRHRFLLGFCAAALRRQTTLLPSSRAPEVVAEALARHPDSHCLIDHGDGSAPPRALRVDRAFAAVAASGPALVDAAQVVAIGFTSGSTGQPKPNPKRWGDFRASTARNAALLRGLCRDSGPDSVASIVATVPSQHMYGMEMTVLLPLLGPFAVHAGRPFYPAEVAAALAEVPAPRLLVTTPVHLRALLRSGLALPPLAGIVSATAPLPAELAAEAEAVHAAPVLELFGSTETCVIGHRRTALGAAWRPHRSVELQSRPDGTLVSAPWLPQPTLLQDLVELRADGGFVLCGRHADLLEIAGKRASLGELTARLLALPGVDDAVVFQAEQPDAGGVRRLAALVVAPGRSEAELLAALRSVVDPVFLPRPLRKVERLPRNTTGKLPRAALLAALSPTAGANDEAARLS